jgi:hypothetical protein
MKVVIQVINYNSQNLLKSAFLVWKIRQADINIFR